MGHNACVGEKMNSQTIVDAFGATPKGQLLLFPNPDMILCRTPFKSIDPQFDREALVHWWMHVYVPDGRKDEDTPQDVFNSWSNASRRHFPYIHHDGYSIETRQTAVRLACYKKDSTEDHLADLEMWLPHIKPLTKGRHDHPLERPGKHVSIFEHTLSQHGCYSLFVFEDNTSELQKLTYGSEQVLQTFQTLHDMVDYVRQHVWYEKRSVKSNV